MSSTTKILHALSLSAIVIAASLIVAMALTEKPTTVDSLSTPFSITSDPAMTTAQAEWSPIADDLSQLSTEVQTLLTRLPTPRPTTTPAPTETPLPIDCLHADNSFPFCTLYPEPKPIYPDDTPTPFPITLKCEDVRFVYDPVICWNTTKGHDE